MKDFIKENIQKPKFIKIIGNKYFIVLFFFIVWMLFLDNYSYIEHRFLNKQINELENNKKYYQEEIKKDKQSIKHLNNPMQIQQYAREKYYMKKDSEDIYIIDFKKDTLK